MQNLRPSETALKVAYGMLALSAKPGWKDKLPENLAEVTETLILEAKVFGYGHRVLNASRRHWMVGLYDRFEKVMPGIFEGIGERKLFMESCVLSAIDSGAKQVLIVGAGFDSLCIRLAKRYPEVLFVEVDHPATGTAKARGVKKLGQPENLHLIKADLGEKPLSDLLSHFEPWKAHERSITIAEGLLYYLPPVAVQELFHHLLRITGEGSEVAFSYMENHKQHGWALGMLNALREPWLSSASSSELSRYIGPGWAVPDNPNPTQYRSGLEQFALVKRDKVKREDVKHENVEPVD